MLKQSIPDWCFFKGDIPADDYYRALRQIGYGAVEMVAEERWPAARKAGLEILNIPGPGMQTGLNRIANHPVLKAEIRALIRKAAANRIPQVIIFSGNRAGQPVTEGLDNCISAVAELAVDAESAGVMLTFEMLNSVDHADYQADHAVFGFNLVTAVDSPNVKVLFDVYHMQRMGERLAETMLKNINSIAHIHVAGSPKRDFPGPAQDINYQDLAKKVHLAGYRGYWGQEFLPAGDPLDEARKAFELFRGMVNT